MSKETLHLIQGYVAKAARRLRNAQPNEILPLLRSGIARTLQDVRSGQTRHMIPLLQDYFSHQLPEQEAPTISNFCRNTSGWENETYTFTLTWGRAQQRTREELILCIYPGAFAQRRANTEYKTLSRLHGAGYPVPAVKHYEPQGDRLSLNRPFLITERIDGHRLWKSLAQSTGEEREVLLAEFCTLLARLHMIDWRVLTDRPSAHAALEPGNIVAQFLAEQRADYEAFLLPGFASGWQWILSHGSQITSPGLSIVHFDFHPDNIILRHPTHPAEARTVVIDWTNAHITDYRFDLAWTLVVVCCHLGSELRGPILAEYERQSGRKVEEIEFFETFASFTRLLHIGTVMTQSAEKIGLRAGAKNAMLGQAPAVQRVYDRYLQLTGLTIPEVESFLMTAKS